VLHRIPLSTQAIGVLKSMAAIRQSELIFEGIGDHSMRRLCSRGVCSVNGFRSSFRDWAAEETNFSREVCEAALGHAIGDETERAYRRGDVLGKRHLLMQAWADFATGARA
jgi:integrase